MEMVTVQHIIKHYGKEKKRALNNISFSIGTGELFGLIGPDGAGKTTLFRILTTVLLADSGRATVNGHDVVNEYRDIRKSVGYMPGKFSLYQDLTVEENLAFFATLFGTTVTENFNLIKDIYNQIEPFSKRKAGKLSGGMKQKLALCCALIHKPSVLFLDEPTTGVDPVSRKELWEMLKRLKHQGISIVVSTPYMDEASLCDRIALIQTGKILSIDTPANIVADYPTKLYKVRSENRFELARDLAAFSYIKHHYTSGEFFHVSLNSDSEEAKKQLEHYLHALGHTQSELLETMPSVEDCFINFLKN